MSLISFLVGFLLGAALVGIGMALWFHNGDLVVLIGFCTALITIPLIATITN